MLEAQKLLEEHRELDERIFRLQEAIRSKQDSIIASLSHPSTPARPATLRFGTTPIDLSKFPLDTPNTDFSKVYETASEGSLTEKEESKTENNNPGPSLRFSHQWTAGPTVPENQQSADKELEPLPPSFPPPPFTFTFGPPPNIPRSTLPQVPVPQLAATQVQRPRIEIQHQKRFARDLTKMATVQSRMPPAHGTNHPTYDPDKPSSIHRFFKQVELARESAGAMSDETFIKYTLAYLPEEIARQWEKLPYASRPSADYQRWKREVMGILSDEAQEIPGARTRLLNLVAKYRRDPVSRTNRGAFFALSLAFQAEAEALEGIISNRDLVSMFLACLNEAFRDRLLDLLRDRIARERDQRELRRAVQQTSPEPNVKQEGSDSVGESKSPSGLSKGKQKESEDSEPDEEEAPFRRTLEDPYYWGEVIDEAQELVKSTTLGPFGDYSTYSLTETYDRSRSTMLGSERSSSKALESVKAKQDDLDVQLQKVLGTLDAFSTKITDMGRKFEKVEGFLQQSSSAQVLQQIETRLPPQFANVPQHRSVPNYPSQVQNNRGNFYSRPQHQPLNVLPRLCHYCKDPSHMMATCAILAEDQNARRVSRQGMNIFVKGELLSRDSPDGLSMKQRVDAILAGTYRQDPKAINFVSTEDWGWEDEPASVFLQAEPQMDFVTPAMLQQNLDRMRIETQGAISTMTSQILQSICAQPSVNAYTPSSQGPQGYVPGVSHSGAAGQQFYQQGYVPSIGQSAFTTPSSFPSSSPPIQNNTPERPVSNQEIRDLLQSFSKRMDAIEEVHLQTRTQAAKGSRQDFR